MKEAERAAAAGFLEAVSLAAAEEAAGPWEAVSLAAAEARVSSFGNRSSHPDRPDPSRSIPTHRRGLLPMIMTILLIAWVIGPGFPKHYQL